MKRSDALTVFALSVVATSACNMAGRAKSDKDGRIEWLVEFAPSKNPTAEKPIEGFQVPSVQVTLDPGVGTHVTEVLRLDDGQSLQSFDVVPESGEIVYCQVWHDEADRALKSEIYARTVNNTNVATTLVAAAEGTFYLDPTVVEGALYYVSTSYGGQTLMRMPRAENVPLLITEPRGFARSPRARSGHVAFVEAAVDAGVGNISVIPASGGNRKVFGRGMQPAWTDDGAALVFIDDEAICRIPIDGSRGREILYTAGRKHAVRDPALSPDNRRVAFAAVTDSTQNYDIYVLEIGTNSPQPITNLRSKDDMPRWLDSRRLLFRSTRGGRWGIWLVELPESFGTEPSEPAVPDTTQG